MFFKLEILFHFTHHPNILIILSLVHIYGFHPLISLQIYRNLHIWTLSGDLLRICEFFFSSKSSKMNGVNNTVPTGCV